MTRSRDDIYVSTAKGRRLYPFRDSPEFDIDEIAKGLSAQCRWHGQWKDDVEFYSVAQHSVYVSRRCTPRAKLWGLMHDAPEYLFGDMPSPVKPEFPDFNREEDLLAYKIRRHFNVPFDDEIEAEVAKIDRYVAMREADALLVDPTIINGRIAYLEADPLIVRPWTIKRARENFKLQFKVLTDALQHAV